MTADDKFRALIAEVVREELAKLRAAPANDEQLTVTDYAARWSISESTVRTAIRENRLEHTRIGRAVRIAASAKISKQPTPGGDAMDRARLKLLGGGRKA